MRRQRNIAYEKAGRSQEAHLRGPATDVWGSGRGLGPRMGVLAGFRARLPPAGRAGSETTPTLIVQRGQPGWGTRQCAVTQRANSTALGSSPSPLRGRALFWGHGGARWKVREGGACFPGTLLRAGQGPSPAGELAECFLPTSILGVGWGPQP